MKEFAMACIGLVGVVVGGWLSPWLSSRLENSRTKRKLKSEIIHSLYVFGNYRKLAITLKNEFGYNGLAIRMMQADNFKSEFPEDKRKNNNENIALLREMNRMTLDSLKKLVDDIVQEESTLQAKVNEIQMHYGESKYHHVSALIQPEIDKSNRHTELYDYATIEPATYREEVVPNFRIALNASKDQLDKDFKEIADQVQNVL
jgi:t-SNARE complex subunit (syntaxin)